jgi:penicillin-binding protein 1A
MGQKSEKRTGRQAPASWNILGTPARRRWTATILFAAALAFAGAWTLQVYQEELPSIEQIYNVTPVLPTKLYDRHGRLFKQFYRERRTLISFEDLPKTLIDALLATEDRKFYNHWGFDWTGFTRAVLVNIRRGGRGQGGSTITQQLARMLFLTLEKSYSRKIKELLTAIKIERTYSKNEILEMYLNTYNFGSGAYGIESAARTYFDKEVGELDVLDCATLVAVLPAPTRYSPLNYPGNNYARRNLVLRAMRDFDKITPEQCDSLCVQPLRLKPAIVEAGVGEYFSETIRQYIEEKYGVSGLYADGLEVYTTMDLDLQQTAEDIIRNNIDSLRAQMESRHSRHDPVYTFTVFDPETGDSVRQYKKLQAALFAMDNESGDVLAIVGGRDFRESQWNRAMQAPRQPGSAFKPFVLTAAIEAGFLPRDTLYDSPIVLSNPGTPDWRPNNFDMKFKGAMTLRAGIAQSRNLIAIKLLQRIDANRAVFYAHQMGIESHLVPVPTLAIGTSEVTLNEMTAAFSCFPNKGIRTKPRLIRKILDRFGNPLETDDVAERQEVLSAKTAYIVTSVLESVTMPEFDGTGRGIRSRGFERPAGAKTGTSDSYMDNWLMGFTPQITCGVWVGYDLKTPIGGYYTGTGAATALPIWTGWMIAAHDSLPVLDFECPEGVYEKDVCRETGFIATDYCIDTYTEVFTDPADTLDYCPRHSYKSPDRDKKQKDKKRIRF